MRLRPRWSGLGPVIAGTGFSDTSTCSQRSKDSSTLDEGREHRNGGGAGLAAMPSQLRSEVVLETAGGESGSLGEEED